MMARPRSISARGVLLRQQHGRLSLVMPGQRLVRRRGGNAGQKQRRGHAAEIIAHDGAEHRRLCQPAHRLHFRQVLVTQVRCVNAVAFAARVAIRRLILGDHLFPAAGIPGQRIGRERRVFCDNALLHQRIDRGDKAAGVAAGIGHAQGLPNAPAVPRRQLGKAVGPARIGPVRRGRVNDTGFGVFNQPDGFLCRPVRQAQKHKIRLVHQVAAPLRVLAPLLFNEQQHYE